MLVGNLLDMFIRYKLTSFHNHNNNLYRNLYLNNYYNHNHNKNK